MNSPSETGAGGASDDFPRHRSTGPMIFVLLALVPFAVAWWWAGKLTREVVVDEFTRFSPQALAVFLLAVVVAGSVIAMTALAKLLGNPHLRSGRWMVSYWIAAVLVWSASLSLGFVTLISIS